MYRWNKEGKFEHLGANIQKSIKIDQDTFDIINGCNGRSFSDKVRNMAVEFRELKKKN